MSAHEAVYDELRAIMLAAAGDLPVTRDAPGDLEIRTRAIDAKTGQPGWFGTVTIRKSYVAYHLIPLYGAPDVAADLPDGLAKRRQGKTCFNFRAVDDVAFAALATLTRRVRELV